MTLTRDGFEPGMGYDNAIRNGNRIGVTRPIAIPITSLILKSFVSFFFSLFSCCSNF